MNAIAPDRRGLAGAAPCFRALRWPGSPTADERSFAEATADEDRSDSAAGAAPFELRDECTAGPVQQSATHDETGADGCFARRAVARDGVGPPLVLGVSELATDSVPPAVFHRWRQSGGSSRNWGGVCRPTRDAVK